MYRPSTRDSWKEILASAVAILDDLERRGFPPPDIVMGGGTVLMFRFEHRLSRDIDFFLASSRSRVGDFADFDRPVAVVVAAVLWACGQRFFFGVVHMSTATWDLRHCDVA